MSLKNKVQLAGYVGNTPVLREFGSGKKLLRFSMSTANFVRRADKLVREVQWHNVAAWNEIAEIGSQYLDKGTEIIVSGELINREYRDRGGEIRHISEILATSILYRTSRKKSQKQPDENEKQIA